MNSWIKMKETVRARINDVPFILNKGQRYPVDFGRFLPRDSYELSDNAQEVEPALPKLIVVEYDG